MAYTMLVPVYLKGGGWLHKSYRTLIIFNQEGLVFCHVQLFINLSLRAEPGCFLTSYHPSDGILSQFKGSLLMFQYTKMTE